MCGIAGAVGTLSAPVVEAVERMSARLSHRGPDGQGFWRSQMSGDGRGVALAHRRLAVIDLDPRSNQPMVDPQTGCVIVYNGEVYNFRELRPQLEAEGCRFHTTSDTEVVLQAYVRWGMACVERFRGMFAMAIWDPRTRQLHLVRDRLGIKPLYVARIALESGGHAMLFASELRAIMASGRVGRKLDPVGLGTYLWNGFVVGPGTILAGVRSVEAGTVETVALDDRPIQRRRYWRLPDAGSEQDVEPLAHELKEAVRLRLVSDVPLGVLLSGGVDSSVVTALAAASAGADLRTFTVVFDEKDYDESRYARAVAKQLGTNHTEVPLREAGFRESWDRALGSIDQPTFDGLNNYFVSRAMREAGITVALAGTGGDEVFGGYSSFRDLPVARRWSWRTRSLPDAWLRGMAGLVTRWKIGRYGRVPPQTRWGKLGDVLTARGSLLDLYQSSYAMYTQRFDRRMSLVNPEGCVRMGLADGRYQELSEWIHGAPLLHAISTLELSNFIGERLLRDTDAASMAVALEVRVPLLDHKLVEAAARLDERVRFEPVGSKRLLRELGLKGLDPTLFDRPKSGFTLPFDTWCRRDFGGEVEQTLLDAGACEAAGLRADAVRDLWLAFKEGAPGLYWSRVWAPFILVQWCRLHGVSL